jgi:hypothetical protein
MLTVDTNMFLLAADVTSYHNSANGERWETSKCLVVSKT